MEIINIDGIEVKIIRKRIRNAYIKINPSGEVFVTAPKLYPAMLIKSFLNRKLGWIKKRQAAALARPAKIKNLFVSGEHIELCGKRYLLNVFHAKKRSAVVNFDCVDLYAKPQDGLAVKQKVINHFYKEQLEKVAGTFVNKWLIEMPVGAAGPVEIAFKTMKSKWGSCNIRSRKITLNTELAKKTLRCAEYVCAHEVLHLKERNHNKNFHTFMKQAFPDWKSLEEELK